jgi:hypothetical protein
MSMLPRGRNRKRLDDRRRRKQRRLASPFRSHPEVVGDDGGRKSSRQASRQPPRIHTSGIDRGRTPASTPPRTNDGHTRDEQRGKNEIMYALLVNGRFTYKETTDKIKELGHAWP